MEKKKEGPDKDKKPSNSKVVKAAPEEVKDGEYGGLPSRNLKKNLGCGG